MIVQFYPDELNWLNATLHRCGSFLEHFCNACLRADGDNYELLRPVLHKLMEKYPVSPERLRREQEDSMPKEG